MTAVFIEVDESKIKRTKKGVWLALGENDDLKSIPNPFPMLEGILAMRDACGRQMPVNGFYHVAEVVVVNLLHTLP